MKTVAIEHFIHPKQRIKVYMEEDEKSRTSDPRSPGTLAIHTGFNLTEKLESRQLW